MTTRTTSFLLAAGLMLGTLPGRAQLAYAHVTLPSEETAGTDPEVGPRATAYKVVHGVVQGQQGPLAGATVWLHGTRNIVVTNAEGEFELRIAADTKVVRLTCGYGGLQEEVVSMAPVQALGSVYLLRPKALAPTK